MGAHPSEYAGEDPCRRRRELRGCDPVPPTPHAPKPSTGPVVEVEVDAPSGYATAGKLLFVAAGAFAGVLLALVALHLYNSGRRRRAREGRRLHRSLAIYVEAPSLRRLDPLDPAVLRALPVVVAAGAFAGVLLALVALHLYNSGRRRRAREGRRLHRSLAIYVEAPSLRRLDPLDPAVLRALPVVAAAVGAGDCAVCLAEFERGEEARALPRCGHRFHVECIDAWFRGYSTCPLCRAAVEAPDDAVARPEVRIDMPGDDAAAKGGAPAIGEDVQRHGT